MDSIYFFQAEHKYVTVGYADGEVLIEDSLITLEEKFPQRFMRIPPKRWFHYLMCVKRRRATRGATGRDSLQST